MVRAFRYFNAANDTRERGKAYFCIELDYDKERIKINVQYDISVKSLNEFMITNKTTKYMRKFVFALIAGLLTIHTADAGAARHADTPATEMPSKESQERPFKAYLYNDELKIYMQINLYDKNIMVPGQDVYGQLDGYIGSRQGSGLWLITSSTVKNSRTAELDIINDYGSEDFTATLRLNADGSYTLKRNGGSTMKFAVRGKWQKIGATVEFKK